MESSSSKKINFYRRPGLLILFCIVTLVFVLTSTALAENYEKIDVISIELPVSELSLPGYTIPIYAQLSNTDDITIPVKALITIDDFIFVATPTDAFINDDDIPEYVFKIPSPRKVISYQFVAYPKNAPAVFSKRITVTRTCLNNIDPSPRLSDGLKGQELITSFKLRYDALNYEAGLYNEGTKTVERLKELIAEIHKKKSKEKKK